MWDLLLSLFSKKIIMELTKFLFNIYLSIW